MNNVEKQLFRSLHVVCAALTMCLLFGAVGAPSLAHAGDAFKILVVVNGTPITQYDLDEQMILVEKSLKARPETAGLNPAQLQARLDEERPRIIKTMIEEQLMKEEIERLELDVGKKQIDAYVQQVLKDSGMLSLEQLEEQLQNLGMTMKQFREKVERDMQKQRLVQGMVGSKLVITDTEVEEAFASDPASEGGVRVHLKAIMVPTNEDMEAALSAIDSGMSFEEAAKTYSAGPVPEEGGDMGFIASSNLSEAWQQAIQDLEEGDVSESFELEGQFVLLKLVETSVMSVDDVPGKREELFNKLRSEKMNKLFGEFMERLKEMAVIEWK